MHDYAIYIYITIVFMEFINYKPTNITGWHHPVPSPYGGFHSHGGTPLSLDGEYFMANP